MKEMILVLRQSEWFANMIFLQIGIAKFRDCEISKFPFSRPRPNRESASHQSRRDCEISIFMTTTKQRKRASSVQAKFRNFAITQFRNSFDMLSLLHVQSSTQKE